MSPAPPGRAVFQLRIRLVDIEPVVWRRLLVPGGARLDKLHRIFQAAMGWQDYHLHSFEIGGSLYGTHIDDYPEEELDERTVTVERASKESRSFSYEYDFGDGWSHEIAVEKSWRTPQAPKWAVCLDGGGACPPEDCGGPGGYADLLDILADPTHDEYEHMLGWAGGLIDPEEFDLALVNARLQSVR